MEGPLFENVNWVVPVLRQIFNELATNLTSFWAAPESVLMAIYKGDRSDAGVKGTRIVISPIGGRKGVSF